MHILNIYLDPLNLASVRVQKLCRSSRPPARYLMQCNSSSTLKPLNPQEGGVEGVMNGEGKWVSLGKTIGVSFWFTSLHSVSSLFTRGLAWGYIAPDVVSMHWPPIAWYRVIIDHSWGGRFLLISAAAGLCTWLASRRISFWNYKHAPFFQVKEIS